jgi:ubiquinone/menaquinone biosynthesis C-methylase UbiE
MAGNFQTTIKWYENHAAEYAAKVKTKAQWAELKQFQEYLSKDAQVLDVGCAAGRDSALLKGFGFEIVGVDLSQELITIAKKENPEIEFVRANFLDLSFEDDSFDGVWASASLVHLETEEQVGKALLEFKRVLKKEGVAYLCVQSRAGQKSGWVKDDHCQEGRFFQFLSLVKIEGLVKESGLEIIESFERESSRPEIKWSVVYCKK